MNILTSRRRLCSHAFNPKGASVGIIAKPPNTPICHARQVKGTNDRCEPTLTDAATATSVRLSSNCELVYAVMLDSNWLVIEVALAHG